MSKSKPIQLGDSVRHKIIKGYTGIVISATSYLNGCRRLTIQPTKLKDGKPLAEGFFDEVELAILKRGVVKVGNNEPGGPRSIPPKIQAPR